MASKFKYNGKELEEGLGYNMYEYEARHYDASLGRFVTIDPLAEDYSFQSPYAYAVNDPIRFIDKFGMGPEDITIRARSKANNGELTAIAVIKTDIDATIDLDLDVDSAPLIDGVTGQEKPVVINENNSLLDKDADAVGVSITGSYTIGGGVGKAKSVVAFLDGPDKDKVFEYDVNLANVGLEGSGTVAVDNYFSTQDINSFNSFTLEGNETGVDVSVSMTEGANVGLTGFMGVDTSSLSIPYIGYSKTISVGIGLPAKAYISSSTRVEEHTVE